MNSVKDIALFIITAYNASLMNTSNKIDRESQNLWKLRPINSWFVFGPLSSFLVKPEHFIWGEVINIQTEDRTIKHKDSAFYNVLKFIFIF